MNKPKILFLVEGAKTDVRLMQKLLSIYGFDQKYDIPDAHFNEYFATQEELSNGTYKQRVNQENRNRNYTKFAVTKEECNAVIQQNIEKARWLCNVPDGIPDEISILSAELRY